MSYLTKDTKHLTHMKTTDAWQRVEVGRFVDGKKVWYGVKFLEWEGSSKDGGFKITHILDVEEKDFCFQDNTRKGYGKVRMVFKQEGEEVEIS